MTLSFRLARNYQRRVKFAHEVGGNLNVLPPPLVEGQICIHGVKSSSDSLRPTAPSHLTTNCLIMYNYKVYRHLGQRITF